MDASTIFQVLGSLCVLIGYWLNSNGHPRQHMAFIGGHVFLIGFTLSEEKWVLFLLSVFIIIMQYRISRKKYKFKKDIVRVKRTVKKIKINKDDSEAVPQKERKDPRNRHKKGHIVPNGKGQIELPVVQRRVPAGQDQHK